jgi:DNA modification methylase
MNEKKETSIEDIVGGSGTTLIAAEQLHRCARLIEYEPIYCDVIIKRWEELTGMKAELICNINDGEEIKEGGSE